MNKYFVWNDMEEKPDVPDHRLAFSEGGAAEEFAKDEMMTGDEYMHVAVQSMDGSLPTVYLVSRVVDYDSRPHHDRTKSLREELSK